MPEGFAQAHRAPFVRLDFDGDSLLYSDPGEIVETRDPQAVRSSLERLRGQQAAGFIAYEAGHALEPKLAPLARPAAPNEPPLLWFGLFRAREPAPPLPPPDGAWAGQAEPGISFERYRDAVEDVRASIAAGDVYQVNLTFPCTVAIAGSPLALYAQLRERARASWSALVFTGTHWLVSLSPELFFTLEEGIVTCRPMKGTALPGSDPRELQQDPKNRAENLMIVDLMRNDLSPIARPGTVRVPALFKVEHYPTLLQMTSTVTAETGATPVDILEAIFPCGSISGAPKIRAMQRIDELENGSAHSRGPYTGAIGHICHDGHAAFNVAIRTLVLKAGADRARYNVGSAIVIDSEPRSEWEECLQKAAFLATLGDLQLIETFALGPSNPLVEKHLDRFEASAAKLGFNIDRTSLEGDLAARRTALAETVRARILLARSGSCLIEMSPMPVTPSGPVEVAVVPRANAADDFRLIHKTTDRLFYDEARKAAGSFEVLFTDGHGFLTEGSFTNLFVPDGKRLLTPPLHRGLLPGVLRQQLIENGSAVEQDVRPDELEREFYIGNSLRGLVPAKLIQRNRTATRAPLRLR